VRELAQKISNSMPEMNGNVCCEMSHRERQMRSSQEDHFLSDTLGGLHVGIGWCMVVLALDDRQLYELQCFSCLYKELYTRRVYLYCKAAHGRLHQDHLCGC